MAGDQQFRNFDAPARDTVADFYRDNHRYQTLEFARRKREQYSTLGLGKMGVWDACLTLDTLIDDSDPDTGLSQIQHLLQTAEALRQDRQPEWLQLTGLLHDLGKILCLHGEPQWAVVGDTFPLGCAFSPSIVYHEFFQDNPDAQVAGFQTECGIYEPHCGLSQVTMSWGHDEYLYHVMRAYLPDEALYVIRYHSFYSAHSEGAYTHLMNAEDEKNLAWVRRFQSYDLYSKGEAVPDTEALAPYYRRLIARYFPEEICW